MLTKVLGIISHLLQFIGNFNYFFEKFDNDLNFNCKRKSKLILIRFKMKIGIKLTNIYGQRTKYRFS